MSYPNPCPHHYVEARDQIMRAMKYMTPAERRDLGNLDEAVANYARELAAADHARADGCDAD